MTYRVTGVNYRLACFFMHFYMMHITCAVMHIICDASVLVTQTQWRMDSSFHQHQFLMSIILWHFWTTFVEYFNWNVHISFCPPKSNFHFEGQGPSRKSRRSFLVPIPPEWPVVHSPITLSVPMFQWKRWPCNTLRSNVLPLKQMFFGLFQYKYWNIVT